MDSACTNKKLTSILCQLRGQGVEGGDIRYTEFLEEISGEANYTLTSGAHSYTVTILQGTVDIHGTTLPEGSWTFSAPLGGDFGQVAIDASGAATAFIQAVYS